MTPEQKQIVEKIRADKLVGSGTCSSIDECFEDYELISMLKKKLGLIFTAEQAVEWCRDYEEEWLERGLNQREGNDDDWQLVSYNKWKENRREA